MKPNKKLPQNNSEFLKQISPCRLVAIAFVFENEIPKLDAGLVCNECVDGFYGLAQDGCRPCGCHLSGTIEDTFCNKTTGQCVCRENAEGRDCSLCKATFYNLNADNYLVRDWFNFFLSW